MTQTTIKKQEAWISKSFLEQIIVKYQTWNSFIESMKEEFKIGMFLDQPLKEDITFETEQFEYCYFNIDDKSGTQEIGQKLTDSLLTKSQAYTVLANEIFLLKKAAHATRIKFDDYKVGFLGSQDQAPPSIIYYEDPEGKTTACIGIKLYGNISHGVGAQHYRFDRLCEYSNILLHGGYHLVKGTTIFCK